MSMLRFADQSRHIIALRLIAGVPLLLIGLAHILGEHVDFAPDAEMRPIVKALGMPLAGLLAPLAVAAEIAAGVSLILGYWARAGAVLVVVTMAVAFYSHLAIEVWPGPNEPPMALPLVILACAAYVLWRGAGRWSLDARAAAQGARGRDRMAEIAVLASGGFRSAYVALLPGFERAGEHTVVSTWGGSMGASPASIPSRLQRGEAFDVVIMAGDGLDDLIRQGKVVEGSRVDLARSMIGVVVRAGAPRPDIGSADAVRRALTSAASVAFSDSASGVYLLGLFERMGIGELIAAKRVLGTGGPVAAVVARGEAEIGFQQVSELLPVPGIDYLGPLPPEIQEVTVFAAGVPASAQHPEAARALIAYLSAPTAAAAIRESGMEPC
ncbi:MAG: DoxX family membrane protein [Dehalococcoidia bacterium]|nr:DoxX family membrane protein [Dehalococcoidia bacterium]